MIKFVQICLLFIAVNNIFVEALSQANNQENHHWLTKRGIRDGNIDRERNGYRRGLDKEKNWDRHKNYSGRDYDSSEEDRSRSHGRNYRTRDGEGRRYRRSPMKTIEEGLLANVELNQANLAYLGHDQFGNKYAQHHHHRHTDGQDSGMDSYYEDDDSNRRSQRRRGGRGERGRGRQRPETYGTEDVREPLMY